jgi:hypothetical protein
MRRKTTIGSGLGTGLAVWAVFWPTWAQYLLGAAFGAFFLLIVIGEIVANWRKSRPTAFMHNLSPQDATAVIGSAPILLHPRRPPSSDQMPVAHEATGK